MQVSHDRHDSPTSIHRLAPLTRPCQVTVALADQRFEEIRKSVPETLQGLNELIVCAFVACELDGWLTATAGGRRRIAIGGLEGRG